jgi:hypothetical protein
MTRFYPADWLKRLCFFASFVMSTMANDGEVLLIFRVLYTLPYRKYLMACVLMVFPFLLACFDGVCIR